MQIAIFGATGRLGRELMRAALARGHAVIAHSRRARSEPAPGVTWVSGDPGPAVQDADAVLIAFGPRSPQDAPFCQSETRKIIEAMRALGRRRLVCVTGAIIGDYGANRTWCFQRLALWIQRRYQAMLDDRAQQEDVIRASGLEWSIFKPPSLDHEAAQERRGGRSRNPCRTIVVRFSRRVGTLDGS